ncbi:NAD(P)H-dependent oxidoreductase [Marinobacterium rhizophilum]|uniref:NAD(P)H-dependent oxidoreductase n=1 Tax=Marinobacterium rhizophilum TaxID=420402 RepID=A0ABY5HMK5_9GAMM|nr:NAD(P)H-dependent oxidoreductase [Marinobacterium rhizophilum]UTW13106.1 NAD(P)H-dependent oxidoreductase [Marinobacterium rhizophilum]
MTHATDSADIQNLISQAFNFRHATKVFDPARKIHDSEFDTILESARLSPSSFGMEPWHLLLVQSPEKRALLRDFSWGANGAFNGSAGQLGTASHFGILLAHTGATMRHHSDYLQQHMQEVKQLPDDVIGFINGAYQKFQEQDFHIADDRQITDWSARQAYIALANMMTTAALMGIDSCPIEGFEMDKTSAVLAEHFDIDPARYQPAVMVAFGYRAEAPAHPKTRRAMEQVVTWA